MGLRNFCTVFYTICGTFKKWPRVLYRVLREANNAGSSFGVGVCGECHGLSNACSCMVLRCVFERHDAVCQLLPLGGCHLFDSKKFLCGADHFARKLIVNTCDLKNMRQSCMDVVPPACVCRCAMWKNVLFCFFLAGGIVRQKRPNIEDFHVGFGPSCLLHTTVPREKKPSMPKVQGKQGPKRRKGQCWPHTVHDFLEVTGGRGAKLANMQNIKKHVGARGLALRESAWREQQQQLQCFEDGGVVVDLLGLREQERQALLSAREVDKEQALAFCVAKRDALTLRFPVAGCQQKIAG